jgi:hypothetical protein
MLSVGWGILGSACSDPSNAQTGGEEDVTSLKAWSGPAAILLTGTIVTPDTTFVGQVLVEKNMITCASPGTACSTKPGAARAMALDTKGGIIAPGLVDTHNHILFDIFDGDDWLPAKAYQDHDQWPNEAKYHLMLEVKHCFNGDSQGRPSWCPAKYTSQDNLRCELDKYGELKGMIAGTTSIVGLPGTAGACFGSLSRSIDVAQNGLGTDAVQAETLFPPQTSSVDTVCKNFTSGATKAFLVHCGEGVDAKALAEFATLGTVSTSDNCLYAPQTTITHGTAFTKNEFDIMAAAGMKLTWSPASNVAL